MSGGREIVLQPPSLNVLRETPFRYGIPILSPPGRTSKGRFVHRGVEYQLPTAGGEHQTHGEIGAVPWRVLACAANEEGAYVTAVYHYRDDPDRYAYFPHDLSLTITYSLRDGSLSLQGEARNEGPRHSPFALGFHPYFRIPGDRGDLTIRIPARAEWPIGPQGIVSGLPEATERSDALREGLGLSGLNSRLSYLQCEGGCRCELIDRHAGQRIVYEVDELFPIVALFLPPWGEAVSFEPHTCIPDAWNLPWGASATGARELAPGEYQKFGWRIECRKDTPSAGGEQE
jgi:aldose 1-epimerase